VQEKSVAQLDRDGEVFVLDLGSDENRFNPTSVAEINKLLDEVVAAAEPRALVLTATGKFFSNGLDLEWMAANTDGISSHVDAVHAMLARVLTLPVPTVAALQGHTFAAGAMLALAADFRVMRADRGFFCLPEVDIHIPFTPGMAALIQARLSKKTAHEAMTTGRRYGGTDALSAGIVDAVAGEDAVRGAALETARPLAGKHGETLAAVKRGMYGPAVEALAIPQPSAGFGP
jgi:enoyl-CoA hydratase/carnithine racemase